MLFFAPRGSIIFSAVFEDHGELKDRRFLKFGVKIVRDRVALKLLTKSFL
jgi:hypothetical protein